MSMVKDVVSGVKEKVNRLVLPKGYVCIPVLIHVCGVTDAVTDSDFFYRIIDFSELLETQVV